MKIRILIVLLTFSCSIVATSSCEKESSDNSTEEIVILKNSSSRYKIVRSEKADYAVIEFSSLFKTKLNEVGNCNIDIALDYANVEPYEILIGETNREESISLYEDIKNLGREGYIVRVDGNKLLVGGTNEYMILRSLEYVFNQVKTEENGKAILSFPNDFEYVSDGKISTPIPEEVITSGKEFAMYPVEKVTTLSQVGAFTVLQGGGTDGQYAYYAFLDKTTDTSVIVKIDIATWKTVKISDPLNTGHTNDITYNSRLGKLVVTNSNDSWFRVSFIDPETLTETGYHVNSISSRAINYIEGTDQYVLGGVFDFYITDSGFNLLRQFTCGNPQYTTQGLFCDGKYIYDARYNSDDKTNYVTVNSIDARYWGTAAIPGATGELENIFRIGNEFYIAYNKTFVVYRAVLLPTGWEE